jgi:hypothetical protein
MAALEQTRWRLLSPIERAYERIERRMPAATWPDADLDAYVAAECSQLKDVSDDDLTILVERPDSPDAAAILARHGLR